MNNYLILNVKGPSDKFIGKCINKRIEIFDINYINNEEFIVRILLKDYKLIRKINYFCDFKIIKYEGINGVKYHFKKYVLSYILLIISFALMDVMTSFIVRINIIHENSKIRGLVQNELLNHGIKKYSIGYDFNELERIKNEILRDNPNDLEWISITKMGMTYVIRIEERIINKISPDNSPRHIVASKDALITKIVSTKGDVVVRSGDYVKKGDLLISGEIKLYEEVKGNTSATGDVYGDVWYITSVSVPKKTIIKKKTGQERYNLNINNKIFLNNKYALFDQENIKEIKILGLKIKIYKEVQYQNIKKKYSNTEIDNLVKKKIIEEFKRKLSTNGKIIMQNVLKKEENDSTIDYRVFVKTNELINDYSYYSVGDESDTQNSS